MKSFPFPLLAVFTLTATVALAAEPATTLDARLFAAAASGEVLFPTSKQLCNHDT